MFITSPRTKTITLRPGDKNFSFSDGLLLTHRASIDVAANTPPHIAEQILYYYKLGYIKPIAHMTEQEFLMSSLSD